MSLHWRSPSIYTAALLSAAWCFTQVSAAPPKVRLAGKARAVKAPAVDAELEADGALLDRVQRDSKVLEGLLRAEVQDVVNRGRSIMSVDPDGATSMLKLTMERVIQAPELSPEVRAQLAGQIEAALRSSNVQSQVKTARDIQRQQVDAERRQRERINQDLFINEQRVDQLMARFNGLMDEERYRDAEAVASIAEEMSPTTAGLRTAELTARMVGYHTAMDIVRDARHKGVIDAMYTIEQAHIPTPDEPPILYPDPEVWQLLTERRRKYKSVDLTRNNPSEAKITAALDEKTEMEFVDTPLTDVIDVLKTRHEIEIQLDEKALTDAGVGTDTAITKNLKGITLRSALRLLLNDLDLTYVIRNEVLMVTSKAEAESLLSTKVYPVADLVIPIPQGGMSGMGGLGGGMSGGGGMGGGGGGMGGGGMGGGGMGGGGGGGGMFRVPVANR